MLENFKKILLSKKIWAITAIAAAIVVFIWHPWGRESTVVSYSLANAVRGDLSVAISGAGQISALKSLDIVPETSGKIISVKVKEGQEVKAGDVIAIIDQRDAAADLSRANASLLSAQASYKETLAGVTGDDLKLYKLSLDSSQASYDSAVKDLETVKRSGAEAVAQAQETLDDLKDESPDSINNERAQLIVTLDSKISAARSSLDKINRLLENEDAETSLSVLNSVYLNSAESSYQLAKNYLPQAESDLTATKILRSDANIKKTVNSVIDLLENTASAAKDLFSALENSSPTSDFSQSSIDSNKTTMSSEASTMTTAITTVQTAWLSLQDDIKEAENDLEDAKLSEEQSIESAQAKIDSAKRSLETAKVQYEKNIAPPTEAEIASAKSSLLSAQASWRSAKTVYDNTVIKASIGGRVSDFDLEVGDQASQSAIGKILTDKKVAIVPFNEVDTAKIKVGQIAELTFDALPDVYIKGTVIEVASAGSVSSGIVNYDITISLDEGNENIKTEMSVAAVITVESKTDIVMLPSEAVKSQDDIYYVEIPIDDVANAAMNYVGGIKRKIVSIGLTDDTNTEITQGLNEGDVVIQKTNSAVSSSSGSSSNRSGNSTGDIMRMTTGGFGGGAPR